MTNIEQAPAACDGLLWGVSPISRTKDSMRELWGTRSGARSRLRGSASFIYTQQPSRDRKYMRTRWIEFFRSSFAVNKSEYISTLRQRVRRPQRTWTQSFCSKETKRVSFKLPRWGAVFPWPAMVGRLRKPGQISCWLDRGAGKPKRPCCDSTLN